MTYEEFIEKELFDFGVDVVDELFSMGFEPVAVNGFWTWQERFKSSKANSSTTTHTDVNMVITIN